MVSADGGAAAVRRRRHDVRLHERRGQTAGHAQTVRVRAARQLTTVRRRSCPNMSGCVMILTYSVLYERIYRSEHSFASC